MLRMISRRASAFEPPYSEYTQGSRVERTLDLLGGAAGHEISEKPRRSCVGSACYLVEAGRGQSRTSTITRRVGRWRPALWRRSRSPKKIASGAGRAGASNSCPPQRWSPFLGQLGG